KLTEHTNALVRIIELLATPRQLPAVFHCTAGKDRTGIVAALVLSLVDVEPEAIVSDYALTQQRMPFILERLRTNGSLTERMQALPAGIVQAEATSMRTFLAALDADHGGAAGWARSAGIAEETIDRLGALVVDDSE